MESGFKRGQRFRRGGQGFRSGVRVLEVLKGISGVRDFPIIRKKPLKF